jgi:hypothetical protein
MTDEQKITRVLACCGKAMRSAWAFDDAEKSAVAALCGADGFLVEGGQEAFRLLMVEHYERRKATSEEFEHPAGPLSSELTKDLEDYVAESSRLAGVIERAKADEPPQTEDSE